MDSTYHCCFFWFRNNNDEYTNLSHHLNVSIHTPNARTPENLNSNHHLHFVLWLSKYFLPSFCPALPCAALIIEGKKRMTVGIFVNSVRLIVNKGFPHVRISEYYVVEFRVSSAKGKAKKCPETREKFHSYLPIACMHGSYIFIILFYSIPNLRNSCIYHSWFARWSKIWADGKIDIFD